MKKEEILELVGGDQFIKTFQSEINTVLLPIQKYFEQGRPISLGKEIWEYVVADSIVGANWCGAGHNIADVKIKNDIGIDVKSISRSINSKKTTESSMYQNFKNFDENNKQSLWNVFVDGWYSKATSIKNYYLMAIIREKETLDCSLSCFKFNPASITYDDSLCELRDKSMKVYGIVSEDYADIIVYKSKTRLEIKFNRMLWESKIYTLKIYDNPLIIRSNLISFFC